MKITFRFFYAVVWLLLGAATGVHWGFDGFYLGLFAIGGLFIGDGIMASIVHIKEHIQDNK